MTRVVLTNVGRGAPARQAEAYRKVRKACGRRALYSWAEVGEADGAVNELGALRRWFGSTFWRTFATRTHVPVTIRRRTAWKVEDVEVIPVMDGIAKVSPRRHLVIVKQRHRVFRGRRRARINTHLVAGAFNGNEDRAELERRAGWNAHWSRLVEEVADLHRQGYDVTVTGDFNRQRDFPDLHPAAVLAAWHITDRIYLVPASGREAEIWRTGTVPLGIDFHRGLFVDGRYRKAS